jgi:phosphopantetheinyl transferase
MRELGMEHTTKLLGADLMKEFDAVRHAPISIKDIESEERAKWWETERFGSDYNVSIAEDKKSLTATLKR